VVALKPNCVADASQAQINVGVARDVGVRLLNRVLVAHEMRLVRVVELPLRIQHLNEHLIRL
jgi:hypothetical protein